MTNAGDDAHMDDVGPKPNLWDRFKFAIMKPDPDGDRSPEPAAPRTEEEVRKSVPADDRERLIGLIAAPLAALIAILVIDSQITHDPPATINGAVNKMHVSVSLYHELLFVLLALAVIIMVTAWFRKRLYMAIALALYGLAIFNLHYWGFGIPFLMAGAWLLVRAYRVQQEMRAVTGESPSRFGRSSTDASSGPATPPAAPNKRYTPPTKRKRPKPPVSDSDD